jgi:hypothetical protein
LRVVKSSIVHPGKSGESPKISQFQPPDLPLTEIVRGLTPCQPRQRHLQQELLPAEGNGASAAPRRRRLLFPLSLGPASPYNRTGFVQTGVHHAG